MVNDHRRRWGFLTNHAYVLLAIAHDPCMRLRDIAACCHIAERTVQSIVADLERAGYLSRERRGRRTRYTLRLDGRLHHPAEAHLSVRELLDVFAPRQHGGEEDESARTDSPQRRDH
ncbi:MarR family transcriptional regulator [Streptomyces collinus]|uniref:MarR family transcriptional regulator n=1 Tax=Streptomyces collinus TaxID=42684 RepID=UPI00332A744D